MLKVLAEGLTDRGFEIDVVATNDNGPGKLEVALARPISENGVRFLYFQRQSRFYTVSLPLSSWLWKRIADYDLVHIHALFSYPCTVAAWAARAKGVPYIVRPLGILNRWGMQNRKPFFKRLSFACIERSILEHAAAVHYTCDQERVEAESLRFHAPAAVIPNPVRFDMDSSTVAGNFRDRFPQLKGKLMVLFLSRLDEKKGLDILLPAFARLREIMPSVALVIAGNGTPEFISTIQQLAASLNITSDVVWAGFLDGEEKREAFTDADIYVLPSYSENFAVAVVEAMAFGVPVVISDQVGVHPEVARYEGGRVVPCDVNALVAALLELAQSKELRQRLGANGRRIAQSEFSIASTMDRVTSLYSGLVHA